ncbi:DUF6414 family protein [Methanobrevibacter ruminantium]|uniref:DUF6414 family protein n=1 Tax=Methanobrevibacter ruminantium TaxID=83816 RepID=UPI003EFC2E42
MENNLELNIPIYLDTNLLLDLLASIDDGFSIVSEITTNNVENENTAKKGGIGLPTQLLNLGFNFSKENGSNTENSSTEKRYHTYGSMMNKVINHLSHNNLIKHFNEDEWDDLDLYSFVEVRGQFIPNPTSDYFKKIYTLLEFANDLSSFDVNQNNNTNNNNNKPKKKKSQGNKNKEIENILEGIKSVSDYFEKEDSQKYIIETDFNGYCILNLFNEYIRDHSGLELPYGNFKVLGKIIRKNEEDEKFSLLEDTPYELNDDLLKMITVGFNSLEGFNLPEIRTELEGKGIQVIPIAVYV